MKKTLLFITISIFGAAIVTVIVSPYVVNRFKQFIGSSSTRTAYVSGEVVVTFSSELSSDEIRALLRAKGFTIAPYQFFLNSPAYVSLQLSDDFEQRQCVPSEEFARFREITADMFFSPYSYEKEKCVRDRWRVVKVSFETSRDRGVFFQENPDVTFFEEGRFSRTHVLYKADQIVRILRSIVTDFKNQKKEMSIHADNDEQGKELPRYTTEETEDGTTSFVIVVSNRYSSKEIRSILRRYPEVDISRIEIRRINEVLVRGIPEGKEVDAAREFMRDPNVVNAYPNIIVSPAAL